MRLGHLQPEQKNKQNSGNTMRSTGKVMVSVFWNARGILLADYLEKGHTIKGTYYADLLRQLWGKNQEDSAWKLTRGVLFHEDSVIGHSDDDCHPEMQIRTCPYPLDLATFRPQPPSQGEEGAY